MQIFQQQNRQQDVDRTRHNGVSSLRLVFQITNGEERPRLVSIPLKESLTIGRGGGSGEDHPDIDLSSFHALENGVSRQHARFSFDGEHLQLEDLYSTNGTRINGFQIHPARQYRLRSGDEIEIGRLRLTINLVRRSL